jgi:formylglycine-generating enzyme required for sulfatase activity
LFFECYKSILSPSFADTYHFYERISMRAKIVLCMAAAAFLLAGCSKDKNPTGAGNTIPPAGMKLIVGGTFMMGDTITMGIISGLPVHSVTLSSFFMDTTEVTQSDYYALMGVNPSNHTGDSLCPVERDSWFDAVLYCNVRSKRDSLDTVYSYTSITGTPGNGCTALVGLVIDMSKNGYRLPTEAEWEYACRAGTTTGFYWGSYPPTTPADTLMTDSNAIWAHSAGGTTARVASKKPNALGLYDMAGNTWEWCNDWGVTPYDTTVTVDPTGPSTGTARIQRGGSYLSTNTSRLCPSYRIRNLPYSRFTDGGFRCVKR